MSAFVSTALLLLEFIVTIVSSHDTITINTKLGEILGNIRYDQYTNQTVYEFLGIQYGVSPVGNLRFRPSLLNESWYNKTTYNATTYGPKCIQPHTNTSQMSENCLYLNIWTPSNAFDSSKQLQKLPVMFWIHGGSLKTGSGSAPAYNGTNLVSIAQNVILVTINYRLGPLGFLASNQLYNEDPDKWPSTGGLNGLYDQIQAMNWVHKYIPQFGGNSENITIFGESAGGNSVCMLLVSSLLPTFINRAIIESCSCTGPWGPDSTQQGILLCNERLIQQNMSTNITQLRQLPATDFAFNQWKDSVDKFILTDLPSNLYANLSNNNLLNVREVMIGFNSMDGIVGYPWHGGSAPKNASEYNEYLNAYIDNKTQVQLIENFYYPLDEFPSYKTHSNASLAWYSINGDTCVACPIFQQITEIIDEVNDFTSYVYEFRGSPPYYAGHGSEIPFVYDHESGTEFFEVTWNQTLSYSMLFSWANYGKYAVPNITNPIDNIYIDWNKFNKDGSVMIFDDNIRVEIDYMHKFRHGACDFWYNEVGYNTMQSICYDLKKVNTQTKAGTLISK